MSKILIIDIDDTLTNTQREILEYVNAHSDRQYRYEEVDRDIRDDDGSECSRLTQDFLRRPDLVGQIKPIDGAPEAMARLSEAGYELHVVSARKENLHDVTIEWLEVNGFMPYIAEVHRRSTGQRGFDFKVAVANQLGALAAFDDAYEVALALAGLEMGVYLIDRPWNTSKRLEKNMRRVESFAAGVDEFLSRTVK